MSYFNKEYYELLIGSLLHDIGKFWQRAEKDNQDLIRNIQSEFGLKGSGNPKHEYWSAYFLKHVLKEDEAAERAKNHHNPDDPFDYIISIADKLSGEEREDRERDDKRDPSHEPMVSIFSQIKGIKKDEGEIPIHYQPLFGVDLNLETLFPKKKKDEAFSLHDYKSLWSYFFKAVNVIDLNVQDKKKLVRLYHLLEVFTVSIPSAAYYSVADISLFDHAKIAAALTACLYQYSKREGMPDFEKIHSALISEYKKSPCSFINVLDIKAFSLMKGDISGIQRFIFDISSKGAAKGLKGRSIYLSVLPEIIAKYILRKFSLPLFNLLFCGGGHFYLLLPFVDKGEVEKIQGEISDKLFSAHKGSLSVVIGSIPLTFNDFESGRFGDKWVDVSGNLRPKKKEKFINIIRKEPKRFFGPYPYPDKLCHVCRNRPIIEENKCSFCLDFEILGNKVSKKKIYTERRALENSDKNRFNKIDEVYRDFGFYNEFEEKPDAANINYSVNERAFWDFSCDGFKYIPNHTPLKDSKILDFDDLADEAEGKKRWAILRGDVDDLGRIFGEGLQNRSISRVISLSRNFSSFFSYWLNEFCKEYGEKTYVIYSGGDDFFIVGSWNVIAELGIKIREDFAKSVCENPHITLSCSVFIAPNKKYPLYKAAQICGQELEEKAKKAEGKDCIVFLGRAFKWNEFQKIYELKNMIRGLTKDGDVSKALLQTIYAGFSEFANYQEGKYPIHRVWRLIYGLSRLGKRHKKVTKKIEAIEAKLIRDNYNLEKGGAYAARWAELELEERRVFS